MKLLKTILLLSILCAGLAASFVAVQFFSVTTIPAPQLIRVEQGQSLRAITRNLQQQGLVDHPEIFLAGVTVMGAQKTLKAGEYEIPAGASLYQIANILGGGKTYLRRVTIVEGMSSYEIREILNAAEFLTGPMPAIPEGSVLPDTYYYSFGETKADLIKRGQQAQQDLLAQIWPTRQQGLPIKTPQQAVILASIVEKETSVPDERTRVAAVFVNRLKIRMGLQTDPSVIYALTRGKKLDRALTTKDLRVDDPYNTYKYNGLPPGPIAHPGRESLIATLNPDSTKELYFVADGTGGHVFANSLIEHNKNVARWRSLKKKQK